MQLLEICLALTVAVSAGNDVKPAINKILIEQANAWNKGDIEAFMRHYWKSERLTFSSGGKTTRGWAKTLANYKKRYPTKEKMGELRFDGLEITPLGDDAALVLGRWRLRRKEDSLEGNFSLVFRRIDGRWLIIHDHTSRLANGPLTRKRADSP